MGRGITMGLIEYTANDEMPDCGQCDRFDGSDGFKCEEWCGPAHGWFGYRRTERINTENEQNIIRIVYP